MNILLPDIIITDRESPQKCSIEPLRGRPDLRFFHSDELTTLPSSTFDGYLFLHVDGTPLQPEDCQEPLLLLDASWKRALKLAQFPIFAGLVKRSLTGFHTRYPRVSKTYALPNGGLASVEALYAARLIQGRAEDDLLKHYYWRETFLATNQDQVEHWRTIWDIRRKNNDCAK